jgi:hypothetical protein
MKARFNVGLKLVGAILFVSGMISVFLPVWSRRVSRRQAEIIVESAASIVSAHGVAFETISPISQTWLVERQWHGDKCYFDDFRFDTNSIRVRCSRETMRMWFTKPCSGELAFLLHFARLGVCNRTPILDMIGVQGADGTLFQVFYDGRPAVN